MDGLDVSFTDASSDADGSVAGWQWDFGDESATSTEQHPVHAYPAEGVYTVALSVFDDRQGRTTTPLDITVNTDPVAEFTYIVADLTVEFSDASTDSGGVQAWEWDFGDGDVSTDPNPTHDYAADGAWDVVLTVTDDWGATSTKADTVYTGDAQPPDDDDDGTPGGEGPVITGGCSTTAGSGAPPWSAAPLLLLGLAWVRRRRR